MHPGENSGETDTEQSVDEDTKCDHRLRPLLLSIQGAAGTAVPPQMSHSSCSLASFSMGLMLTGKTGAGQETRESLPW